MEACTQSTGHAQFFHSKMKSKKYSMNLSQTDLDAVSMSNNNFFFNFHSHLILSSAPSLEIPRMVACAPSALFWKMTCYFGLSFQIRTPRAKNAFMICDWNKIESSFRWQLPYYFLFVQIAVKLRIRNNFFGQEYFVKFVLQIIENSISSLIFSFLSFWARD